MTAKNLQVGMRVDTDAGYKTVTGVSVARAPISGDETVTVRIDGYPHPIHLRPAQTINVRS